MLVDLGAELVLGIDLCPSMLVAAGQLATGKDGYILADVQEMGFLRDNTFDIAVSYLNQYDLPGFKLTAARSFAF
jgi:ubiquinone/menaquinone biosynthesis C-methylase UbiE